VLLAPAPALRIQQEHFARRVQTLATRVPSTLLLATGTANYSIPAAAGRNFSLLRVETTFMAHDIAAASAAVARKKLQAAVALAGGGGQVVLHKVSYDRERFQALLPCLSAHQIVNSAGFCQCDVGFFGEFEQACNPCGPGRQESGAFRMACDDCPVNSFCANSTHMHRCPPGSTAPRGSSVQSNCTCVGGFTGPAGGPCAACTDDAPCESASPQQITTVALRVAFDRSGPPVNFEQAARIAVARIRAVDPSAGPASVSFKFASLARQILPLGPILLPSALGFLALGDNIQRSMAARLTQPPQLNTIRVLDTHLLLRAVFIAPLFYGAARTRGDLMERGPCALADITAEAILGRPDRFLTSVLCRGLPHTQGDRFAHISRLYALHPMFLARARNARRLLDTDADEQWDDGTVEITDDLEVQVLYMTDPVQIQDNIEEVLRGSQVTIPP